MSSDKISYFGYGSLVNRDTRPSAEIAHSARLTGWQRVWEHRVVDPARSRSCTSLSIEPCPQSAGIDGVIVSIPRSELAQLDAREAGYERLELPASAFELPPHVGGDVIMVYRSLPQNRCPADAAHPVLQSYIDCVMAGYLRRFGQSGLAALIDSTKGWERAVFNDRDAPLYPRWVHLDDQLKASFDACLAEIRGTPAD